MSNEKPGTLVALLEPDLGLAVQLHWAMQLAMSRKLDLLILQRVEDGQDRVSEAVALVVEIEAADRLEQHVRRRRYLQNPQLGEVDEQGEQPAGLHAVEAKCDAKRLFPEPGRMAVGAEKKVRTGVTLQPKQTDRPEACHQGAVVVPQHQLAEPRLDRARAGHLDNDLADAVTLAFGEIPC